MMTKTTQFIERHKILMTPVSFDLYSLNLCSEINNINSRNSQTIWWRHTFCQSKRTLVRPFKVSTSVFRMRLEFLKIINKFKMNFLRISLDISKFHITHSSMSLFWIESTEEKKNTWTKFTLIKTENSYKFYQ